MRRPERMFGSRFKWLVVLIIINGILIETDHAYKQAMDISNIILPSAPLLKLPEAAHNTPLSNTPLVKHFDSMTVTSGTVEFLDSGRYLIYD